MSNGLVNNIPKSVIDWLFQNIQKIYTIDPRTTFNDSLLALSHFKQNLRPRTRVFVDPRGKSRLLLCLYGKFPHTLTEKDSSISTNEVPVLIWIDDNYPLTHPQCFIDMDNLSSQEWIINVGKHIDSNGQIYLAIFNNWDDKDSNCNIINTLEQLKLVINTEVLIARRQPLLPPKLDGTIPPPRNNSVPPPIPERGPNLPSPSPSTSTIVSSPISTTTKPSLPPPPPSRPERLQNISKEPPIIDLMDSELTTATSPMGQESSHQRHINELSQLLMQLDLNERDTVEKVRDARLNKINTSIDQFHATLKYETDKLNFIKSQLSQNKNTLMDRMKELDRLESNWNEKYCKIEDMNVSSPPPLQITETLGLNQLYDLIAQDMALDDTIAILSELLNKNKLTLDVFIRKTRELAKEQFMIRLHIEKIVDLLNQ